MIDAACGHVEAAYRRELGERLLKFRFTSRGFVVWPSRFFQNPEKTVRSARKQGVVRIAGIRPVIDVPLDGPENFDFLQAPEVWRLPNIANILNEEPMREPTTRLKIMKKWKRITHSFLEVFIPVAAFPWAVINEDVCNCPENAITPHLNGVIPTFCCAICGRRSWCACMSGVVEKLLNRDGYSTSDILALTTQTGPRENCCHLCRGVPITSNHSHNDNSLKGLMSRYWQYRNMAAIENDWDWKLAENTVRERLGVPRIGEGWIAEAMLLRRIISLLPDEEVIHQGSPDWLGRQRFDIWLPGRSIALEYNGIQHYLPVDVFGGVKALERTIQRDEQKRRLCAENGVKLIEIPYDQVPNDANLAKLIFE